MHLKESETKTIFSKNLKYFLKLNNKKQADLARYLGIGSGIVSAWCNAEKMPRMDKIQSICNWLGIELSDLLEDKNKGQNEDFSVKHEINRIAKILYENADLYEFMELCVKMPPEKLKALLEFVKVSQ